MKLSSQQEDAFREFKQFLRDPSRQLFRIFGYAGTGKTTIAKALAELVDGDTIFCAFTGKAAHVLQTKGCPNAQTIHSLIYITRDRSRSYLESLNRSLESQIERLRNAGFNDKMIEQDKSIIRLRQDIQKETDKSEQPIFKRNPESAAQEAALIVVDECSMVDNQMGEDLMSYGTKILVLGDPAQLPPVGGEGFFTKDVNPDVMLTEIHRQAQESPIIRMATLTRQWKPLQLGDWGDDCHVYEKGTKLPPEQMMSYAQIITGKNRTRQLTNQRLRQLHGREDKYPIVGDRLVCLRNNSEHGLLNGMMFDVTEMNGVYDAKVSMSVRQEDTDTSLEVVAHEHHFLGTEKDLQWYEKKEAEEFAYGYALTCHKSQGSQWKNIAVFNESHVFRNERWRWLYTAITRASDSVHVVNM